MLVVVAVVVKKKKSEKIEGVMKMRTEAYKSSFVFCVVWFV